MRKILPLVSVVAATGVAMVAAAPAAHAADSCANAQFRTGPSANLPDCRAYEMVSPAQKDAYTLVVGFGGTAYPAVNGDSAYFGTITPFADPHSGNETQYVSVRGSTGWRTRARSPAYCREDQSGGQGAINLMSLSDDFATAIFRDPADSNCAVGDEAGTDIYIMDADGPYEWVSHAGVPKTVALQSAWVANDADASHVAFSTAEKLVLPLENGRTTGSGLYVRDRAAGETVPVGLRSDGSLINACGANPPGGGGVVGRMSSDARVVFFAAGSSASVPGCSPVTDDGGQLYARIDDATTVLLADSQLAVPDTRRVPTFLGATRDGSRAWFTSTERLTDDATVSGGLYSYDLTPVLSGASDTGVLSFLSPSINAAAAGVTGLIGSAEDGSRIYFTATGLLDPAAPATGTKLYLWDGGQVSYVMPWASLPRASVSADGSKLAVSASNLEGGPRRVYLYDADDPGPLLCVSCTATPPTAEAILYAGSSPTGDRPAERGAVRYVTDDGRVFFASRDRLVERDVNALMDVYEYDDGELKLLSAGNGAYDSLLVGVTAEGRDVFFSTFDSLVGDDFDNGDQDIYVARAGGGFPAGSATVAPCAGDACQGGSTSRPVLPPASSAGFAGAGNASGGTATGARVSLVRPPRVVRGARASLRVRVSGRGRISTAGRGLRKVQRRTARATTYRVPVRLSKRARQRLRRTGKVTLRIAVRFAPAEGRARTTRLRLTFRAPAGNGR